MRIGRTIFLISVVIAAVAAGAEDSPLVKAAKEAAARGKEPAVYLIGQKAPELKVTRWFNSQSMSLRDLRGNVVLLDFWATWCGPCIKAFPDLTNTARAFQSENLKVLLLHKSTPYQPASGRRGEKTEQLLPSFIEKYSLSLPIGVVSAEDFERYGAFAIPLYVAIDKKGVVRYARIAAMPDRAFLRALLDE